MENYFKGKNVEEELERDKIPIKDLPENFLWMQVKGGSKMTNLLSHATGILEDKSATAVVWSGVGVAIPKAISCAEIVKRQFSIEHQVTKLIYKKVDELWEPKVDGLETIVVKRQIPVIHILLSVNPIADMNQTGYQSLQGKKFWQKEQSSNNSKANQQYKSRKPFKHKKPQS
ncbi:ribonuclease P protein subunit p25-like protein [Pectinophora gossypiella]|uniref:ribonuclease P protein subunit p25-like protein n=1 Tax=Pectinophora gossypiella TaxID=13191 RepID=UPI00214E1780|nr:ribonuclease P protein subunit p25-like protein [Pectinophora gossypiella]